MTRRRTTLFGQVSLAAVLALALGPGNARAAIQFLGDGAQPNGMSGGWDLPAQGFCLNQPSTPTRPACLALRLNPIPNDKNTCQGATVLGSWATSGVCNDLVHTSAMACVSSCSDPAYTGQASCEESGALWIGRVWNTAVGVCAISMEEDDRNAVICAKAHGNWITSGTCVGVWVFPAAGSYNPPLLTSTAGAGTSATSTGAGPGDQCLRCHNAYTQYNGARVRDVEDVLYMGHKNMSRKVIPGNAWGGPPLHCVGAAADSEEDCEAANAHWYPLAPYPSDDAGNLFNWMTGQVSISGTARDLLWIYGDWLSPLPREIAKLPASSSQVCSDPRGTTANCVSTFGGTLINNAGASYSCARCHTTGWTSDAAIGPSTGNLAKEPEKSFPGVTWDRNSNAGFGVVNLSGGVLNDPNKYASWDQFGILCTRCHSSAVENTSNGGALPYSAPTGMSSHHSNLTAADFPGFCSNTSFRDQASCVANMAIWNFGYCTDSRFTRKAQCEAGPEPAPGSGVGTWVTPCSNNLYGNQTDCEANLGTWTQPTSSCNVAGLCNNIAGGPYTSQAACTSAPVMNCPGGVACQWAAATDVVSCMDAGGHYTGSLVNRGPIITALCTQCHRQETSGLPYADTGSGVGSGSTSHPGTYVKIGPYHSTVTFPSHPHGNMFLNSPHGKFTGAFNQIGTAKFGNGYNSFFQFLGEASGTGNGCTGCHNVHRSSVEQAGVEKAIKECGECHSKNLNAIQHPKGIGTPLEHVSTDPASACETCHMPNGVHMFRINTDASYSTFSSAALTTITNANTAPDGSFTNAVWVDLNAACGQCHGGGTQAAATTGSAVANNKVIAVDSTAGFLAGERIQVADAGNFVYDQDTVVQGDFESYVVSVDSLTQLTLVGGPPFSASNAAVLQNPTKNNAPYFTKTQLAGYAQGIHNDTPMVSFGYTLGNPDTLTINVFASASCNGTCDVYDWDWGDGSPHGSGVSSSHHYATGGTKAITLTVEEFGVGEASKTKEVTVYTPDFGPTVGGTACGSILDATNWSTSLTDSSTDDHAVSAVTVVWGDGSLLAAGGQGTTFTHTYRGPGTYNVVHKALDTIGQQSIRTCALTVKYFTISGTVESSDASGNLPVPSAQVTVKDATTLVTVKTTYTAVNGAFSAGSLKPGTYTLTITKSGYTFADPAAGPIIVGPSSPGNIIKSTVP